LAVPACRKLTVNLLVGKCISILGNGSAAHAVILPQPYETTAIASDPTSRLMGLFLVKGDAVCRSKVQQAKTAPMGTRGRVFRSRVRINLFKTANRLKTANRHNAA